MAAEVAVETETALSGYELLKSVYEVLKKEAKSEIALSEPILSEIANDDDGHRSKMDYMQYDKFLFLRIGSKWWALGFGQACGDYPAHPFSCDITALEFPPGRKGKKRLELEIREIFQGVGYFSQSLIYALSDGSLMMRWCSKFCARMKDACKEFIGRIDTRFVAQGIKIKPGVRTLDLRPVVTQDMRYKPEFVGVLVNILRNVLKAS